MNWKNAPLTVWLFIALMVATLAVAALPGDPTIGNPPIALAFTALWSYLLLRRSTAAWWWLVGLYGLALAVLVALTAVPWDATLAATIILVAASLAALLAPQTRAWMNVGSRHRAHLA
jgi:hypothetical protein